MSGIGDFMAAMEDYNEARDDYRRKRDAYDGYSPDYALGRERDRYDDASQRLQDAMSRMIADGVKVALKEFFDRCATEGGA